MFVTVYTGATVIGEYLRYGWWYGLVIKKYSTPLGSWLFFIDKL